MVTLENLLNVYRPIIEPYFDYCCIVRDGIGNNMAEKLQRLQNRAACVITNATYSKRSREVLSELGWQTLKERRHMLKAIMMFKVLNGMSPKYMEDLFKRETGSTTYNLRASRKNVALPKTRTDYYRKSFAFMGAKLWNALPDNLKEECSLESFKNKLKHVDLSIET